MNLQELGEFGWIAQMSAGMTLRDGVLLGIGDDAAVLASLTTPVVTTDALIEGVHFRRDWTSPRALGRKAMAVNVSDIAAMGAKPVAAFVSLGLSSELLAQPDAKEWLDELYAGMEEVAAQHDFTIAGGDTTRSPHAIVLSVTMVGECGAQAPVLRSGAQAGDALIVTGSLGEAAAGLFLLQHPEIEVGESTREAVLQRHFEPATRVAEVQAALNVGAQGNVRAVHAALDLSDGLAGDAAHIARRSGVMLQIEIDKLPLSPSLREIAAAAQNAGHTLDAAALALHGGEDYELLLCVDAEQGAAVCAAITSATGTPATIMGQCLAAESTPEVVLLEADGSRRNSTSGWQHF
jgi:thiamine-monophosphate kinase